MIILYKFWNKLVLNPKFDAKYELLLFELFPRKKYIIFCFVGFYDMVSLWYGFCIYLWTYTNQNWTLNRLRLSSDEHKNNYRTWLLDI